MLTVLFGQSADNLKQIADFYKLSGRVLDVTHGAGTLVKQLAPNVKLIASDIDPTSKARIIADAKALPFAGGVFSAAIMDPPYLIGSKQMSMGPVGAKTWSEQRSTWRTPSDLQNFLAGSATELRRVVQDNGIVVVKIMNCRYKGRLVRNDDAVIRAFEANGFALMDTIVYIRTFISSFAHAKSATSAHGYYLIFRKQA